MEPFIQPPRYLYQYYSNINNAIKNIQHRQIYLSRPSSFNDVFDCTLNWDIYDIFDFEYEIGCLAFLNTYFVENELSFRLAEEDFANCKTIQDVYKMCIKLEIPKKHLCDAFMVLENKIKNNKLDRLAISCFSEEKDSLLMWAHYSNNLHGVCLQFDTNKDPDLFNNAHKVKYSSIRPKNWHYSLFVKPIDWNYENEWRIIIETKRRRISTNAISGIIVGEHIPQEKRKQLRQFAREHGLGYQVAKSNVNRFKIDIVEDTTLDYRILF